MLRSLLMALDGIADHAAALDTALGLARATGARLELRPTLDRARLEAPEAVPLGGEAFRRHAVETRTAQLDARLGAIAGELEARLRREGLDGHVVRLDGDAVRELAFAVEAHDLLVLPNALRRRRLEEAAETELALPLEELVPACARPLLLADARPLAPGPAVAANDGSPGSARALHAALLLGLLAGREVHVVTVAAARAEALGHAEQAALLLARHGLAARAHGLEGQGGFADELLARIEALEPALVVMGAFGRRSWRERLFGAVTHHLVDRVEAPLLLSS
jgi:nucleotide-binding universal stress UspA family protein